MKNLPAILLCASVLPLSSTALRAASTAENWTQHCASCHGDDGTGQTKMGRRLHVKDLSDAAYQKSFTDEELFANLKAGEKGPDGKVKMKPYGDLLSDPELKDLVGFVRSLAKAGQKT
jgi:cytochrome c553